MRAVRLQCASGHELLILRIVFLLDGNCVTLRAFACRSGASAVCVCVCVRACGSATACVRVLVGACEFAHACVCAHSQTSRLCVSEEGGAENPSLVIWNYFCWVIAWRVSSLCAPPQCLRVFPRLSPASLLLLGWMMGYDCPDGCWSSTLALTGLGIASST